MGLLHKALIQLTDTFRVFVSNHFVHHWIQQSVPGPPTFKLHSTEHVQGWKIKIGQILEEQLAGGVLHPPHEVSRPLEGRQDQVPPKVRDKRDDIFQTCDWSVFNTGSEFRVVNSDNLWVYD